MLHEDGAIIATLTIVYAHGGKLQAANYTMTKNCATKMYQNSMSGDQEYMDALSQNSSFKSKNQIFAELRHAIEEQRSLF